MVALEIKASAKRISLPLEAINNFAEQNHTTLRHIYPQIYNKFLQAKN